MSSGEALDIAAQASPQSPTFGDSDDPNGRQPGDRVSVVPDDYGKVEVRGEIISLSTQPSPSGVTTIGSVRPWCISHARGSLSAQADLAGSDRGGSFLLSCFVGANDAPFLNAADYMAKRIPGARKIVHSRGGPRVRRGQKMLPGLRVFFGSSAVLIARIIATSVSLRLIDSQGFFSSPMPCSAETDPRSDFSAP
jgi:hypothetical protein